MIPVSGFDVQGQTPIPAAWDYRINITAPGGTETVYRKGGDVLHFRTNCARMRPWQGQPPWKADATLDTAIAAEVAAGESSKIPALNLVDVGQFKSPVVERDMSRQLLGAIRDKRKFFLFGTQRHGATRGQVESVMPKVDAGLNDLRNRAMFEIVQMCGVPAVLYDERAEGTSRREGFRQMTIQTLEPLAKIISGEVMAKTGEAAGFDFSELHSADIQGRARAFGALVKGGLNVDEALSIAGLE